MTGLVCRGKVRRPKRLACRQISLDLSEKLSRPNTVNGFLRGPRFLPLSVTDRPWFRTTPPGCPAQLPNITGVAGQQEEMATSEGTTGVVEISGRWWSAGMIEETGRCAEIVGEIDMLAENTGVENFNALEHMVFSAISECFSLDLAFESWDRLAGAQAAA